MAADEAAVFLKLSEVQRKVRHVSRQDAAGSPARQVAFEVMAVCHAAAQLDQIPAGGAGSREHHAGVLYAARNGIGAQALGAVLALSGEPRRAFIEDSRYPVEGLDIV